MKIHHIGYLVKNIEKAQSQFKYLGYAASGETLYDDIRKANILFMQNGDYVIELVSPASDSSVVANLIKKHKNMPYHMCYESSDFDRDLDGLSNNGFTIFGEPSPAPAIQGRRVAFLISPSAGMIELLEDKCL